MCRLGTALGGAVLAAAVLVQAFAPSAGASPQGTTASETLHSLLIAGPAGATALPSTQVAQLQSSVATSFSELEKAPVNAAVEAWALRPAGSGIMTLDLVSAPRLTSFSPVGMLMAACARIGPVQDEQTDPAGIAGGVTGQCADAAQAEQLVAFQKANVIAVVAAMTPASAPAQPVVAFAAQQAQAIPTAGVTQSQKLGAVVIGSLVLGGLLVLTLATMLVVMARRRRPRPVFLDDPFIAPGAGPGQPVAYGAQPPPWGFEGLPPPPPDWANSGGMWEPVPGGPSQAPPPVVSWDMGPGQVGHRGGASRTAEHAPEELVPIPAFGRPSTMMEMAQPPQRDGPSGPPAAGPPAASGPPGFPGRSGQVLPEPPPSDRPPTR